MSIRRGAPSKIDSENEEDDEMSSMASPAGMYKKSRGRSEELSNEGGRASSRSRSRSSSVLRRIIGGGSRKDRSKKSDDGMSVASGMTSLVTTDTKSSKIKRIKKIRKGDGSTRRSSSCDRTRSNSCDRTRTRTNSCDPTRSRSRDHRSHLSFSGPVDMDDDTYNSSALDQKLRKKSKLKYKSRRITDSGGVDSDGDYGAADSDGDVGSIDGARSVGSEGILSAARKIRRKKRPKKTNHADDETIGSSKASLTDSMDYRKTPLMSLKSRGMHVTKVAAIPEPPMSPEGAMLKNEMENLFPSPKSEKKKLPRVKRKGKPDISVITFAKEEFSPIVDRTPGARPSDYRKSQGRVNESVQDPNFASKGRPPLPECAGDGDTAGSWRKENVSHRHKNGKEDAASMLMYSQNNDSGLSIDVVPHEMPTSNRSNKSNKSLRSYGRSGDNDTVLSMTDTVSSLNRQLEDQREESKDLQKRLTDALTKVASLNEELRMQEGTALKANAKVAEVQTELGKTQVEKSELQGTIATMKEELIAKDARIETLQQVVETQLDTVEFLETRLEEAEDELFKMEEELKELDAGGLLDQSVHAKKLLARKDSLHKDVASRKGSIRVQTEESRSVLGAVQSTNKRSRATSDLIETEEREAKIAAREKKLDEWEKHLVKVDVQLKQGKEQSGEEACIKAKLQLMEKRERRMEENRDSLLQEKETLLEKVRALEIEKSSAVSVTTNDEELAALKRKITKLESENSTLLSEIKVLQAAKQSETSRVKDLEKDRQDLCVKLDHVRSTAIKDEEEHLLQVKLLEDELTLFRSSGNAGSCGHLETIKNLRDDIAEKDIRIANLEAKLEQAGTKPSNEDDGKDLLIRELQNQLVAAKKEAYDLSSGDQVKRLKIEIKTLKQGYNDVKKRMKSAEISAQGALKKKDQSLQAMKNEMAKLQRDLERLEKREKNLKMNVELEEGDLQKHIEDLEDEIDHWKATNANLENELNLLKAEISEFKKDGKIIDGNFDDDASIGSFQSLGSLVSEQQGMEMSSHSVSSGLFFVSDSTTMRSHRSISVSQPLTGEEPSTPSQRALRSVSSLWSKMRNEPAQQANPAIPYGAGILDDDSD